MLFDAQRADAKAIEAFDKVLALQPDVRAWFQRGQIYARRKDVARGRADLEAVLNSPDATLLMRMLASQWMARLLWREGAKPLPCALSSRSQCLKDDEGVGGP
jgi:hypothetical protein